MKVPYHMGHRAKYFVKKYGGGFGKEAKRSRTYVESPGGRVKRTRNYLLFKVYPKVNVGDKVVVVRKPEKKRSKDNGEPVDWNKAIERFSVKLTGIATLYVILSTAFGN